MNPLPPDKRIKFFVYVIESPSPVDLYHRRSEGEIIKQAASLNQIPCMVKTSINGQAFEAALKIGLKEAMDIYPGLIPMLHISAHGSSEGIQLSSSEMLNWFLLEELFRQINQAFGGTLLLCLSCCEGYSGVRMAMTTEEKPPPFFALVSNGEKPSWSDTAVAYSTFYHLIAKGHYIRDAVDAMCVASGNQKFWLRTAEDAKKSYIEYIQNLNTNQVQRQLEEQNQKEAPGHLAKLVEMSVD